MHRHWKKIEILIDEKGKSKNEKQETRNKKQESK